MQDGGHLLSIIVVALNEGPHLPRLKASIDALQKPSGVEIETILADGGSSDNTRNLAREVGFTRLLELPDASIPVCRNKGVEEANGDWIAFVDADCEVADDWLMNAAPFLAEDGPSILGWPAAPPDPPTWVQSAWYAHWTCKNNAYEEHRGERVIRDGAFRLITTRNVLLNRGVFDQLEGFDEGLPTGEDTDFVFRATLAGINVLALPRLMARHYGDPDTLKAFYKQQLWHANRNKLREDREQRRGQDRG